MRPSIFTMILVILSASVSADASPPDLMGPSDTSCSAYLGTEPKSQKRREFNHWVSGRIVAIIPASAQSFLRKQPWARLESDLVAFCQELGGEDLFIASAMLAHKYRCEAENYHPGCPSDT